ncbi:hypothetical protein BS78_02G303600 [Paspalum vaginatum]|nr:hypothetical protein BS78_02G303600 [Paspalum vaginatum]
MAHNLLLPVAAAVIAVALLMAARATGMPWPMCGDSSNFEANSSYEAHLNFVAATLPKNTSTSPDLFSNVVVGSIPEQLWALGLCRGDVDAATCFSCLTQAFPDVRGDCSNDKDATIYYDYCMLHYSDVHTLPDDDTGLETDDVYFVANSQNVTSDPAEFVSLLAALVNATADYAANNSTRRFATGEADTPFDPVYPKLYTLAQCRPDWTPAQCRKCLDGLVSQSLAGFQNSIGARVLAVDCTYRYEGAPFYNGTATVRLASPSPGAPQPAGQPMVGTPTAAGKGSGRKRTAAVIPAGIACFIVLMLIILVCCFLRFRRRIKMAQDDHRKAQCTIFDLPTLQEATEYFSEKNKVGEGGFGTVYKGILSDGQEIAVKTILGRTGHGLHQLHNEVLLLAELQHKNLVRLHGFSSHQNDTLLVYEYIKNGSLDNFLFDDSSRYALNWEQQHNIILGIAKGILYLHEDSTMRIIHRDLKANNILLDDNKEPKIADFGLARLLGEGHTQTQTTKIVGTFGYMAPEYISCGSVSPKIDVFSFGVLALEIVTRRSNCSSDDHSNVNLLSDVWDHWTKGTMRQMLHPSLDEFAVRQALRCIQIGLLCVQPEPDHRPDISAVVFTLTRDNIESSRPRHSLHSSLVENHLQLRGQIVKAATRITVLISYWNRVSLNDITLSQLYPR